MREIRGNVAFILKELAGLDLEAGLRERVSRTCQAMEVSLQFDVGPELRNLVDKLYPASGALDPGLNPDPRATLKLIREWLWSDLEDYDALVRSISAGPPAGDEALLSVLLHESGGNMFAAWKRLRQDLETIGALVGQDERWRL